MERLTVRGYRVTRSRARGGGVIKRKERPRVRAHRFGLGQLLRARVRPMAGDSPSGERLAGQSGLVFHIGQGPRERVGTVNGTQIYLAVWSVAISIY